MALKRNADQLRPVYLPHPVINADIVKRELRGKGYQILDASFAPPNYKVPADAQSVVDAAREDAEDDLTRQTQLTAQPDGGLAAATAQINDETLSQPAPAPAVHATPAADTASSTLHNQAAVEAANQKRDAENLAPIPPAPPEGGNAPDGSNQTPPPPPPANATDSMTDQELRDAVEKKTGNKPAWNASRETLLKHLNS